MVRVEGLLAAIKEAYPGLALAGPARLVQSGQYNDVLMVQAGGQPTVFRFPRYAVALETLKREVAVLQAVQGTLPLAVPAPLYQWLEGAPVGRAFMGYPLLEGAGLERAAFQAITDETVLDRMAGQMAAFLEALHRPAAALPGPLREQLAPADGMEEWAALYRRIRQRLFAAMRPQARREVADFFESYLDNPTLHHFEPCLRHGDLGLSNLLFAEEGSGLSGVLDFAFTTLGDRATDYAALGASLGEGFLERLGRRLPAVEEALPRVRFYQGTFALQEALFGAEEGDEEAWRAGMERYI